MSNVPEQMYVSCIDFSPHPIRYNIESSFYFVRLVSVNKNSRGKSDTLSFYAPTVDALKKKILAALPNASFSPVTQGVRPDPVREKYRAELAAEQAVKDQLEKDRKQGEEAIRLHHAAAARLSPEEINIQIGIAVRELQDLESSPYSTFLRERLNFFSWPDGTWANWAVLLQYLKIHQIVVPTLPDLIEAMGSLTAGNNFHMQSAQYKRSQIDTRNAVKPVTVETVRQAKIVPAEEINLAVAELAHRFGSPVQVSKEGLSACGFTNVDALFDAIQARYSSQSIKEMSREELQKDLQQLRIKERQGKPISHSVNGRGY